MELSIQIEDFVCPVFIKGILYRKKYRYLNIDS